MGRVIKFPRVRGRHKASTMAAGTSAVVIILPVVRIERGREAPAGVKARAAGSVAKPAVKSVTRSAAKPVIKPLAKATAKPAAGGKPRRKRVAPTLPSPACGRG